MKIKTMKELKEALSSVPDDVLEHFEIALTDDGLSMATDYTDVKPTEDNPYPEDNDSEWMDYARRMNEQYPALRLIGDFFNKVIEAAMEEDYEEAVEVSA